MKKYEVIAQTLANDENSSTEEMIKYFMSEMQMSQPEAAFYVAQRQTALLDMTFSVKKLKKFTDQSTQALRSIKAARSMRSRFAQ